MLDHFLVDRIHAAKAQLLRLPVAKFAVLRFMVEWPQNQSAEANSLSVYDRIMYLHELSFPDPCQALHVKPYNNDYFITRI